MSYASPPPSYNFHRDQTQASDFSATSNLSLEPLSISDPPTQVAAPLSANFPQFPSGAGLTRSNSRPLPAVPPAISPPPVVPMSTVAELPSSDPFPPAPQPDLSNSLPPPAPRAGIGRIPSPGRRAAPVDEPFDSPAPSRPPTLRSPPVTSEAPRFGGYGGPSRLHVTNFDDDGDALPDLPPGNSSRFGPPRQKRSVGPLPPQNPPQNPSPFVNPPVNDNNNPNRLSRLNPVDVPRESLALDWSSSSPPPSHVQRHNAVHQNRSASEVAAPTPRVFYPPQPPPPERDNGPSNNNHNRRRGNATSPTSLAFNDINNALSRRSSGQSQRDPPQRGTQRLQVNVQPPLREDDEWGTNTRPRGGAGSGRPTPSPVTSTSRGHSSETGSSFRASGSGWQPPRDDGPGSGGGPPPVPRKEYRKGFYRLYSMTGALFSVNPMFSNDLSLSSFDVEHVSPPRLAQNYIGYICQREHLKPSGVKLYLTTPQRGPEQVTSMDMVIYMSRSDRHCGRDINRPLLIVVEPGSELPGRRFPPPTTLTRLRERDLDSDLPHAYYRLYGTSSSLKGAQRPLPSQTPLYREDPSLTTFFVDYVPPPLRAKDYIAYIAELEGIHPTRITLYLRSQPMGGDMIQEVEAEEVKDPDDFITRRTASETSDRRPIMVTVELGTDEYGDVDLNSKGSPLPMSFKGIARSMSRTVSRVRKRESVVY
ncbi:hypothetical protein FS837_011817 [Tulasnella sp. UAMH 9824]|nr:hypothetical protein FS837_011817 [Tulasnella sp. UAMH 9824]